MSFSIIWHKTKTRQSQTVHNKQFNSAASAFNTVELHNREFDNNRQSIDLLLRYHQSCLRPCKRYHSQLSERYPYGRIDRLTVLTIIERIPIKEDNHFGDRFGRTVYPLTSIFEPLHTVDTACIFRDNARVDISALVGTPRHEAGTPFNSWAEAIPTPIKISTNVSLTAGNHTILFR